MRSYRAAVLGVATAGFLAVVGAIAVVLLTLPSTAQAQAAVKVKGRVLDGDGHALAGAEVASMWSVNEKDGRQARFGGATSDADGRFVLNVDFYGRDAVLMAMDSARKAGGTAVVRVKDASREAEIRVAPLVRVHGKLDSRALGRAPEWTNVYMNLMPDRIRLLQNSSEKAEFSMLLPPGAYDMNAYGSDVKGIHKALELRAGEADVDLGTVDLPATFLALQKGKTLPPWSLADARGVRKDVTLADFRGKWVAIDFWGYWCSPCVQQLAEMIDFYHDHAADREKFEILAFHDGTVKDFAEMDAKTRRTRETLWRGRELPFPVLLDASRGTRGATTEAFEIQSFPTTILIDPEGKLVGEIALATLEEKLTPIPPARRIARALDRDIALGMDGGPLARNLDLLGKVSRVPIRLDGDALRAAGVKDDVKLPLKLRGSVSLRSWLELLLDPLGLEAVPGDDGIVVVPARQESATREPSEFQKRSALRIEEVLAQKTSFAFKNATLEQVAAHFEGKTSENFVLDPAGRRAGTIDPEATLTGSATDVPLRQALEALLRPHGLIVVVKHEVVVLAKSGAR